MTKTKTSMNERQLRRNYLEKRVKEAIYRKYTGVRASKDTVRWFNLSGIRIPEEKR